MTESSRTLEELAEAYLDGDLPRGEALAFERDLASRSGAATALSAALALRDLLASLPPLVPPPGLAQRIAESLPLRGPGQASEAVRPSPLRAALGGLGWAFRGTTLAALGTAAPAASASAGMAQLKWALGPLGAPAEPVPRSPRPLWQRALFGRRAR